MSRDRPGPVGGPSAPTAPAILTTADGIRLRVRLTPKAARDGLDGTETLSDGTHVVLARVRAVPEKGGANRALLELLAKAAGVPKSSATLVSGDTSRVKIVALTGDGPVLAARLVMQLGADRP